MNLLIYSVRPAQNGAIVELQPPIGQRIRLLKRIGLFMNELILSVLSLSVRESRRNTVESSNVVILACAAPSRPVRPVSRARALVTAAPARAMACDNRLSSLPFRLSASRSAASALDSDLPVRSSALSLAPRPGTIALATAACVSVTDVALPPVSAAILLPNLPVAPPFVPTVVAALRLKVLTCRRRNASRPWVLVSRVERLPHARSPGLSRSVRNVPLMLLSIPLAAAPMRRTASDIRLSVLRAAPSLSSMALAVPSMPIRRLDSRASLPLSVLISAPENCLARACALSSKLDVPLMALSEPATLEVSVTPDRPVELTAARVPLSAEWALCSRRRMALSRPTALARLPMMLSRVSPMSLAALFVVLPILPVMVLVMSEMKAAPTRLLTAAVFALATPGVTVPSPLPTQHATDGWLFPLAMALTSSESKLLGSMTVVQHPLDLMFLTVRRLGMKC